MVRPSYACDLKALIKGWQDNFTMVQQWPKEKINVLLYPGYEFTSHVPGGWCIDESGTLTCGNLPELYCIPKDVCICKDEYTWLCIHKTKVKNVLQYIIPLVTEELLNTCNVETWNKVSVWPGVKTKHFIYWISSSWRCSLHCTKSPVTLYIPHSEFTCRELNESFSRSARYQCAWVGLRSHESLRAQSDFIQSTDSPTYLDAFPPLISITLHANQ